ncbi:MAG: hypothetical protein IPP22_15020 [Nitrosomonas sp.]|nr:hypothetical protein [Nitrosomonas sp.]
MIWAKEVFQIHCVDEYGKAVLVSNYASGMMTEFCQSGASPDWLEACGSSHHWARKLRDLGIPSSLCRPSSSSPASRPTSMIWLMVVDL